MNRRLIFVSGILGALALFLASTPVQAQRGGGGAHGRPAGVGNPGQHGRPATAGNPASHQPRTPNTDHPNAENRPGKPTGTTGRQTVGDQLARNTNLAARLQGILPAGTDVQKASAGFKNLGQFVAAAHVSHNLDIPFDSLRGKMIGGDGMSLGQAIQELKPAADAKTEERNAERAADATIRESGKS